MGDSMDEQLPPWATAFIIVLLIMAGLSLLYYVVTLARG